MASAEVPGVLRARGGLMSGPNQMKTRASLPKPCVAIALLVGHARVHDHRTFGCEREQGFLIYVHGYQGHVFSKDVNANRCI